MRTETFTILENENDLEVCRIFFADEYISIVQVAEKIRNVGFSDKIMFSIVYDKLLENKYFVNKNLLVEYLSRYIDFDIWE